MMESNISSSLFYNLLGSWALFLKKMCFVLFYFLWEGPPAASGSSTDLSLVPPPYHFPPTASAPALLTRFLIHHLKFFSIRKNSRPKPRLVYSIYCIIYWMVMLGQLTYGHVGNLQDREKWSCQNPAAMKWQVWLGSHTSVSPTTFQCQSKGTAYRWLVHKHKNN
jgi:hypothetical protein